MPRGGRRPGTGGARPGAGRPRKHPKTVVETKKDEAPQSADSPLPPLASTVQPLDYMLTLMRDQNANPEMRARMAVAAAPYVHPKVGEQGKKEQKNEAAKKIASRFGASAPPPRPGSTAH
jgi:phage terminase small subunit